MILRNLCKSEKLGETRKSSFGIDNQGVTPLASLASLTREMLCKPPHFTAEMKKLERNPADMHAASHPYGTIALVSLHH
jgi:hypothetical protein